MSSGHRQFPWFEQRKNDPIQWPLQTKLKTNMDLESWCWLTFILLRSIYIFTFIGRSHCKRYRSQSVGDTTTDIQNEYSHWPGRLSVLTAAWKRTRVVIDQPVHIQLIASPQQPMYNCRHFVGWTILLLFILWHFLRGRVYGAEISSALPLSDGCLESVGYIEGRIVERVFADVLGSRVLCRVAGLESRQFRRRAPLVSRLHQETQFLEEVVMEMNGNGNFPL